MEIYKVYEFEIRNHKQLGVENSKLAQTQSLKKLKSFLHDKIFKVDLTT
jgi:hypothetical protein